MAKTQAVLSALGLKALLLLTLMHSEWTNLNWVLAILSAIGLKVTHYQRADKYLQIRLEARGVVM